MPCPTCGQTMQSVWHDREAQASVFWCPTCGTLRIRRHGSDIDDAPAVVERLREFAPTLQDEDQIDLFERLGLREAVYNPDDAW